MIALAGGLQMMMNPGKGDFPVGQSLRTSGCSCVLGVSMFPSVMEDFVRGKANVA